MVEIERSRGNGSLWLIRAGLISAMIALIYALTPQVGFIHDGQRYAEMADDPFGNSIGSPWSLRIGVPLLVRVSPFSTAASFYGIAALSALAAGLFVAATTARLGLPERHARAAGVLTVATQTTVTCFWAYYIDLPVIALYAAVIYFAIVGRHWLVVPLVVVFTPMKEVAVLAGPLASFLAGRRGTAWRFGIVATLAGIAVYAFLNLTLSTTGAPSALNPTPTTGNALETQWNYATEWFGRVWGYGLVRYSGNAILSVFGVMWVLWVAGFRRSPVELRRALWWVLLTLPVFMTTQWERSWAFYLPIAVPLALLAIPGWRWPELGLLVAGSAWISGIAPTQTVADDSVTSAATKLAWMAPGGLLVAASVAVVLWRRHRDRAASGADVGEAPRSVTT